MTTCKYSKTKINYMKYLARGRLGAHELAAFIANINPDILVFERYNKKPNKFSLPHGDKDRKFDQYYDIFHEWSPGPISYHDGNAETEYWLEEILRKNYPKWEEIPKEIIDYIKGQIENGAIKNNEYLNFLLKKLGLSEPTRLEETIFGIPFSEYPATFRAAAHMFYNCWAELPQNMRRPTKQQAIEYFNEKIQTKAEFSGLEKAKMKKQSEANPEFEAIWKCSNSPEKGVNSTKGNSEPFKPLAERNK